MPLNLDIIKKHEGRRLTAYLCPANVYTIGYGTTVYPNGSKVQRGDTITASQAEQYLSLHCGKIKASLKQFDLCLNDNQLSAIISFVYNVGIGAFTKSTLLKKIKADPSDITIRDEFMRWNKAAGKVLVGLVRRRSEEASLYFTPIT